MTIRIGVAAMATALALAGTAQAQYGPYPPPPPAPYLPYAPPPPDNRVFTGARAEVRLSYDTLRADLDDRDVFAARGRHGLGYGGEIGFDLPVGGALTLGGYAGADGSTIRECAALAGGGGVCLRPGRYLSAGGRIGVALGRGTLLYAKGGYTNGQIRASLYAPGVAGSLDTRANGDGFHVGGGVEAALTRRTYGKLDYTFTRLRRVGADEDGDGGVDFDRHQVQAALGLRF